MFNPSDTFPYIGLRPFSEEDSLYFKGRDEQILQLTALLEANKFLMVTGASGDGKSSLVYAGLVPNARAGFFNAKYTNWVVADFRPERSPLHNLSKTISKNLRIGNEESVEVELRRGFSSLVELYTSSSLFLDEQSEEWTSANGDERDFMQRKAANLLIVADQFEEFFTNPENYYKNSPSADSQLVINLLLETARISITKNFPIYIVCTMRSDYIGQCAAFRGLPEFIGFSQFFVPRLKRKEMVQVVKEPAGLHGDKISNRLVERVVYDLGEGIDQLPVLEHAMNEVWIQAKNGSEELDLIHYAMAGGMPPNELPVEDQKLFNDWFSTLPQKLQEAYQHPGLSHIIDTHANKLYLSAADNYNQKHPNKISTADAQLIIKVAFICLTKMDEDRAVRNRMTLQEITDILARPDLNYEIVGGVLNIFREPGNTFLRPYITDDPETHHLRPDSVLDITHESLIRNWELLLSWAKEEYDYLAVYEDFKKQLDRWITSKKSRGFLLPIGPLTFFEDWYDKLKPNQYWVNRYLDPGLDKQTRLKEAQQIVENTQEFLNRSASKVRVTRLIVKYGATRIAAIIGSILILLLCGFYYRDAQSKENENVVKSILTEGSQYLSDPRFDSYDKSNFLIMKEFVEPGSFIKEMDQVPFKSQFELIRHVYSNFTMYGGEPELKYACLYYGDSVLVNTPIQENNPVFLMDYLRALNVLVMTTDHYLYYHKNQRLESIKQRALARTKEIILKIFSQGFQLTEVDIAAINGGIENVLNNSVLSKDETTKLLSLISPYESQSASDNFKKYFPVGKQVLYNRRDNYKHNAGYLQLAYLYGYLGQVDRVKACVDSLMKYHPNYATFRTNILHISTELFTAGFEKECDELLTHYALKQNVSKKELYERWLENSGFLDRILAVKIHYRENHNPNIELMEYAQVEKLFDQYYSVILKEYTNTDELNFNLAIYYKHRGIILSKINGDQREKYKLNQDSLFGKAFEYYRKVPSEYLDQPISVIVQDFAFALQRPLIKRRRADLFLYPDHFPKTRNDRLSPPRYFSDAFLLYVWSSSAFTDLYTKEQDFELFNEWFLRYERESKIHWDHRLMRNYTPPSEFVLSNLDSIFTINPIARQVNANRIRLMLADYYIEKDEIEKIDALFNRLDLNRIKENLRQGGPPDALSFSYRVYRMAEYYALKGRKEEAIRLTQSHTNKVNFIKVYSTISLKLLKSDQPGSKEDAYVYLDSAITEFERTKDFLFVSADPRIAMVLTPALIGGKDMKDLALSYVKAIQIGQQRGVIQNLILGTAIRGDYYQALSFIPQIALVDRVFYFNAILSAEGLKKTTDPEWRIYFDAYQNYWIWEMVGYEQDLF